MIGTDFAQLVTALKDNTIGLQVEIDAVAAARSVTLPTVPDNHIYGLDTPVRIETANAPFLVLSPIRTASEKVATAGKRDNVHSVGFEFGMEEPDDEECREQLIYVAEALMRFLDNFNSSRTAYVGTSGVIVVLGWRVDYTVTWKAPPNALRGFVLEANILARDTFD